MGHPVGHPAALSDGEPSVDSNSRDGSCGDEGVGSLHGGNQLAGHQTQEPLPTIETLGEGGGDADDAGGDARDTQVQDVQVFWSPVCLFA